MRLMLASVPNCWQVLPKCCRTEHLTRRRGHLVRSANLTSASRHVHAERSFDHLVGTAKQVQRERKTERYSGLEVDYQFDFRGLLNRQVGGLLALENSTGVERAVPALDGRLRHRLLDEPRR